MTDPALARFDYVVGGEAPLAPAESALWLNDDADDPISAHEILAAWNIRLPALWLRFGRSALGVALQVIGSGGPVRLAIPDYQCAAVVENLRVKTSALLPYGVNSDLTPGREDILRCAGAADAVMTCSYFGSETVDNALAGLGGVLAETAGDPWVIEDRVTAFPDPAAVPHFSERCDFAIISMRKIYPVPDGSVLVACSDRAASALDRWNKSKPETGALADDAVIRNKVRAKLTRDAWLCSGDLVDDAARSGFRECSAAETAIDNLVRDTTLDGIAGSTGTLKYLAGRDPSADIDTVRRHRAAILDIVRECPDVSAIISDGIGIAIPVQISGRDRLRRSISHDGVFLPVHWPRHDHIEVSSAAAQWHDAEISMPTLPVWKDADTSYLCDRFVSACRELAA